MKIILQFEEWEGNFFGGTGTQFEAEGTMLSFEQKYNTKEISSVNGYRERVVINAYYEMTVRFSDGQVTVAKQKPEPVTPAIFERMRRAIKLE